MPSSVELFDLFASAVKPSSPTWPQAFRQVTGQLSDISSGFQSRNCAASRNYRELAASRFCRQKSPRQPIAILSSQEAMFYYILMSLVRTAILFDAAIPAIIIFASPMQAMRLCAFHAMPKISLTLIEHRQTYAQVFHAQPRCFQDAGPTTPIYNDSRRFSLHSFSKRCFIA